MQLLKAGGEAVVSTKRTINRTVVVIVVISSSMPCSVIGSSIAVGADLVAIEFEGSPQENTISKV